MPIKIKDGVSQQEVPPNASRNTDPISKEAGAHPVETGVGAAVGGAALGVAGGLAAGPIGAVAGAVVGAVMGGYAGKEVGEHTHPTVDDPWFRDNFTTRTYTRPGDTYEMYQPAYRYGSRAQTLYPGKSFAEIEAQLMSEWESARGGSTMTWSEARHAVKEAYDRTVEFNR